MALNYNSERAFQCMVNKYALARREQYKQEKITGFQYKKSKARKNRRIEKC